MVSPTELANLLRASFSQADRLLRLETPLGPNALLAEKLDAAEHIDAGGFRLELTALSDNADIDSAKLLGEPVRLDLLTQQSRSALRPFHGHVTRFEQLGANGGLVRYRLVIEPWLAFLRHRQDSFLFQDMSVIEVVDSVFGDYQGQGRLVPAWRWALRDSTVYTRRSIITQYEESDFDFITRLLAEEGLFYFFEHEAKDGHALGVHRMVIADSNDVFADNAQASIRFGRADATATEDVIDRWQGARRWQTNAVSIASWDYRANAKRTAQLGAQQQSNDGPQLTLQDTDYPGQYWFEDNNQAQRVARLMMEALELRDKQFDGEGTARTLATGTRFQLLDHFDHDDGEQRFAVLAVKHQARNNFNDRFGQVLTETLGALRGGDVLAAGSNHAAGDDAPFYRNHFTVVRDNVPVRPQQSDAQGRALHPRPTVIGSQTALVVGADDPVHTDRDHRIKVQFHWQRGARSASRQPHPAGDDNARASAGLGAWVRVTAPVAGPNWGGVALPRVGQEVLVEFLQGDIDRPVVVGAAYNGRGQADAQYNQNQAGAAGATGNAPAWFAGDSKSQGAYAHNAVLSGIKTQALAGSQSGSSGYNQLVFDDTEGQGRTQLSTTQAATGLVLGHHKEQSDSARQADLGHGAALATDDSGAVRAGAGLLLTAHSAGTSTSLQDSEAAASQIEAASDLAESLADAAQKQKAGISDEPAAKELPALKQLRHTTEVLRHTERAGEGAEAVAYSEPHLQVSAPKGVLATTPADAVLVAGTHVTLAAKQDANVAVGGNLSVAVAEGVSLYAHGKSLGQAGDATPGIAMHAASGKVGLGSKAAAHLVELQKDKLNSQQRKDVFQYLAHKVQKASRNFFNRGGADSAAQEMRVSYVLCGVSTLAIFPALARAYSRQDARSMADLTTAASTLVGSLKQARADFYEKAVYKKVPDVLAKTQKAGVSAVAETELLALKAGAARYVAAGTILAIVVDGVDGITAAKEGNLDLTAAYFARSITGGVSVYGALRAAKFVTAPQWLLRLNIWSAVATLLLTAAIAKIKGKAWENWLQAQPFKRSDSNKTPYRSEGDMQKDLADALVEIGA